MISGCAVPSAEKFSNTALEMAQFDLKTAKSNAQKEKAELNKIKEQDPQAFDASQQKLLQDQSENVKNAENKVKELKSKKEDIEKEIKNARADCAVKAQTSFSVMIADIISAISLDFLSTHIKFTDEKIAVSFLEAIIKLPTSKIVIKNCMKSKGYDEN